MNALNVATNLINMEYALGAGMLAEIQNIVNQTSYIQKRDKEQAMKCIYRATTDCRMPKRPWTPENCRLCLMGQQADEIGLLTSAVMNMSIERTLEKAQAQEASKA